MHSGPGLSGSYCPGTIVKYKDIIAANLNTSNVLNHHDTDHPHLSSTHHPLILPRSYMANRVS